MTRKHFLTLALSLWLTGSLRAEPVSLPALLSHAHDTSTALAFDKYPAMQELAVRGKAMVGEWLKDHKGAPAEAAVKRLEKGFTALAEDVGEKEWRKRVAELQAGILEYVRSSDELKKEWNLYYCPMVKLFWAQPSKEEMANAYMGTTMLDCGVLKRWSQLPAVVKGWPLGAR